MTTIQAKIVVSESITRKQLTSRVHNNSDDYFRLISSHSGKLMASISNTKQLTLFDIQSQSLINDFSQENVTYCTFNEDETVMAITTRKPSIKLYQITKSIDKVLKREVKSVSQVQQIRPVLSSNVYGWIVSTIDNGHFIYTQNQQIYALNAITFKEQVISIDPLIKTKCRPYYVILDREMKNLVTSSRVGQICKFSITINNQSLNQKNTQFWPQIILLQSTTLSPSTAIMISDINQSRGFILVSTSKVIESTQPYYNTFIVSKSNINIFSKVKLEQQLIAPPLTIMSDNVQNYLLTFLKGEKSLYVYDLGELERQNKLVDYELIQSDDSQFTEVKSLSYKSKQQMPFLIQAIHYNGVSKNLLMGISNYKNEDKLIYMDFGFNCTDMTLQYKQSQNMSIANNGSIEIKPMCSQECGEIQKGSVFSFGRGQCIVKSAGQLADEKRCKQLGQSYKWSVQGEYCELQCFSISESLSVLPYGQPAQCFCQTNYQWDGISSSCVNSMIDHKITNETGKQSDNTNSKNSNENEKIPQQQSKGSSVGIAIGISFGVVTLIVAIVIALYLYRRKKLCFKLSSSTSYIEQNQLKQTQSAKESNSDQNNQNNENNSSKNENNSFNKGKNQNNGNNNNPSNNNDNKSQHLDTKIEQNKQQVKIVIDNDNDEINADSQRNL